MKNAVMLVVPDDEIISIKSKEFFMRPSSLPWRQLQDNLEGGLKEMGRSWENEGRRRETYDV